MSSDNMIGETCDIAETALETPVVLFIFRRPDQTKRVLEVIRHVQPQVLFVIADGPRPNHLDDPDRCQATRQVVATLDWPCQVYMNYAASNLGCGRRIVTGLDWVFEQVDRAIILEDDCLPNVSFFRFCDNLLKHYQTNEQVMHVGGHNRLIQWQTHPYSYHTTHLYGSPWGWATWKRAWKHFRKDVENWRSLAGQPMIAGLIGDQALVESFMHPFKNYPLSQLENEWGFIWTLSKLLKEGISIVPSKNLVSNIGIESGATHTKGAAALLFQNTPRYAMKFPLHHPQDLRVDHDYERQHLLWYQGKSNPILLMPLVHHLMDQKRYIHALAIVEKVLKDDSDNPDFNDLKTTILKRLKR